MLNTGAAVTCVMVYVALATALFVKLLATAIALMVSVVLTEMGPAYLADEVVGVDPSVV